MRQIKIMSSLGQKRQRFEAAMKNLGGTLNQRQRGFESKIPGYSRKEWVKIHFENHSPKVLFSVHLMQSFFTCDIVLHFCLFFTENNRTACILHLSGKLD